MESTAGLLAQLLLVPYIVWGVKMLAHRFRYHEEASLTTEALTLVCVTFFIAVEIALLKTWLQNNTVFYVFTILGLLVSVAALYGHMAISLTSRLIVDTISYGHQGVPDSPRLGAVEALERQRDYEAALQECLVIARIYPHEPGVHLHLAENLLQLHRPDEAATWLERATSHVQSAEKNLTLVNRLCELYQRELGQPEKAVTALRHYLTKFPNSPYADSVQERIQTRGVVPERRISGELSSLSDAPMLETENEESSVSRGTGEAISLEAMEDAPETPVAEPAATEPLAKRKRAAKRLTLSSLEETPLTEAEEEGPRQGSGVRFSLAALEDTPLEEQEEVAEEMQGSGEKIDWGLQAMDDQPLQDDEEKKN